MEKEQEEIIEPEVILEITKEEKTMAMLVHILAIPGGFLIPLIFYIIKKDESQFIEDQAKESLNFQITSFIALILFIMLAFITCGYSIILFPILGIGILVLCIIAGVKANEGIKYRYPVNIRFIK
jgi:uncharacterized Tic20 family protein